MVISRNKMTLDVRLLKIIFILSFCLFHRVGCYCSMSSQQSITKCAQPLYDIGAFGANKNSQTFTWEIFSKKTREDFIRVCDAFTRFDLCAEVHKVSCFNEEPIKSQYQTAAVILDYLCNDGYEEMIKNFDCFTTTLASQEMTKCQSGMMVDTSEISNELAEDEQSKLVCRIMQNYMSCIRPIFKDRCGLTMSILVKELIRRPAHLVLADCTLSSSHLLPTIMAIFFCLIISLYCKRIF